MAVKSLKPPFCNFLIIQARKILKIVLEIPNKMEMNWLVILTISVVLIAVYGDKIVMKPLFCNFLNIYARKILKIVLEIPNKMEMD